MRPPSYPIPRTPHVASRSITAGARWSGHLEVGVTDSSIGALLWKSLARKGLRGLTEGADGLVSR